MKKKVAAALVVVVALALAGCANDDPDVTDVDFAGHHGDIKPIVVRDVSGRDVQCIIYAGPSRGNITCDWEHAQ